MEIWISNFMKVINHHKFSANLFQGTKRFPKIHILKVRPITFTRLSAYFYFDKTKLLLTRSFRLFLSFLSIGISDLVHSFFQNSIICPFLLFLWSPFNLRPLRVKIVSQMALLPFLPKREPERNLLQKSIDANYGRSIPIICRKLILLKLFLDHDILLR